MAHVRKAFISHGPWGGPYTSTQQVDFKQTDAPRSGQTATGYGNKIPTSYMVNFNNRWHRVYCVIYSNSGTCYIKSRSKKIIVDIDS